MLGVEVGTIVPVVHIEPAVDKRFIVVRLRLRVLGFSGELRILGTGWPVGDRNPWFVWSNEMDGRYLGTETFVGWSVPSRT